MRTSIVDFARLVKPLNEKLVKATTGKKKTKRLANGVKIAMSDEDKSHFDALKFAIMKSVTLSFPVQGPRSVYLQMPQIWVGESLSPKWYIVIRKNWPMNKNTRCYIVRVGHSMVPS